jgi:hypothetical protein
MPETRFRKGDLVRFQFGMRSIQGVVKEERGPIGIKGRQLYLVEFRAAAEADSTSLVELPAGELQRVREKVPANEG